MSSYSDIDVLEFIEVELAKGNPISLRQVAKAFNTSHSQIKRILLRNNFYDEYLRRKEEIINQKLENIENTAQIENSDIELEYLKKAEFYKQKANYWKREFNKLLKQSSYEDRLIQLFYDKVNKYQYINFISKNTNNISKEMSIEPVLIISDLHIGEIVDSEQINGINSYDLNIAKKRLNDIYNKFISLVARFANLQKVSVFILGDIVSGIIHEELLQGIPIADQVIEAGEMLSEVVYELSKKFNQVEVYGVIGNHQKVSKKVYYKNKYSGFDYLVYKYIEAKCKNLKNVKCVFPKSSMLILNKFDKWNILLRHGDGKTSSFAGIPVYGISKQSNKLQQAFSAYKDIYIHYQILGHWHSNMTIPMPNGQVIVCGSLKGLDEYCYNNFMFSEPSQTALLISKEDGIISQWTLKPTS
jgi:hypothetical protein